MDLNLPKCQLGNKSLMAVPIILFYVSFRTWLYPVSQHSHQLQRHTNMHTQWHSMQSLACYMIYCYGWSTNCAFNSIKLHCCVLIHCYTLLRLACESYTGWTKQLICKDNVEEFNVILANELL